MNPTDAKDAASLLPAYPANMTVMDWVIVVLILAYFLEIVWLRPRAGRVADERQAAERREERIAATAERREERQASIDAIRAVAAQHELAMRGLHERIDRHEDQENSQHDRICEAMNGHEQGARDRASQLEAAIRASHKDVENSLAGVQLRVETVQADIHKLPVYRRGSAVRSGMYEGLEIVAPEPEPSNEPSLNDPPAVVPDNRRPA